VTVALKELGKEVFSGQEARTAFLKPGQRGKATIILNEAMPVWDLLYDKTAGRLVP
jgi:hypothetical protein